MGTLTSVSSDVSSAQTQRNRCLIAKADCASHDHGQPQKLRSAKLLNKRGNGGELTEPATDVTNASIENSCQ